MEIDIQTYLPLLITAVFCGVIFWIVKLWTTKKVAADAAFRYYRQLFYNLFFVIALIALISAAPIKDSLKGQILSLIGIVISGAIALSSTTLLGNTLAGIMLRITRNFRSGDFIEVNEYFGKVSGRSLLNIEIQTMDRGLISLPNSYLVSNPVKVFPETGIFISVEVSLGYDVPRSKIEKSLLEAAKKASIENAFVEVKALQDHCVLYVLHAMIVDLERFFSTRSNLHCLVVDELHHAKIEIVSPRFINSRAIDHSPIIAKDHQIVIDQDENIDDLLFEKANQADRLEILKDKISKIQVLIEREPKDSERLEKLQNRLQKLNEKASEVEKSMSA